MTGLQDMALFVEVARAGSFSRACAVLGIPNATLSRRIAALERSLQVRLFNRSTRRVELTEIGRRYLERCAHLVDEARAVHEQLHTETKTISGDLRISLPVDFAVSYVGPVLTDFAHLYPDIRFHLDLSHQHADLVTKNIDIAIRIGNLPDSTLVARRIGDIKLGLFASPIYAQARGLPERPAALPEYEVIDGYPAAYWKFSGYDHTFIFHSRFNTNNVGMMRTLAERGMGIALLPLRLAQESVDSHRLVRVLASHEIQPLPIHALMSSRKQTASVRTFIEFLITRLDLA